jgi:predicted NBD/HSP70 family sugar kinase
MVKLLPVYLPEINQRMESSNSPKTFQNLLGVTFGTGYGAGIVSRGELFVGDNSAQGEINRMRNKLHTNASVEENVSIAVSNVSIAVKQTCHTIHALSLAKFMKLEWECAKEIRKLQ